MVIDMSEFRLCIKRKNITPYYSKIIKREIFTIEELSYFIYENIHLINDEFVDNKLCEFVYNCIGEDIRNFSIADAIGVIFNSNNLYGIEDTKLIINIVNNYKDRDFLNRCKMIGDKCLINKDYNVALKHYNNILEKENIINIDEEVIKNVKFNKGVTLARMLNFKDAYIVFRDLYRKYNEPDMKYCYYTSLKFYDNDLYEKLREENDDIFSKIDEDTNDIVIDNLIYNSGTRYMLVMDDIIDEWKSQICEEYIS